MLTVQCRLHPRATAWQTLECGGMAISGPALIQISSPLEGMTERLQGLLDAILHVLRVVQGPDTATGPCPAAMVDPGQWRGQAGHGDGHQLAVVLGDGVLGDGEQGEAGQPTISIEPPVRWCLDHPERAWVLPVLPAGRPGATNTVPARLQALNVCFWSADLPEAEADEELALTVLARAGITSLDRRVFISYRRQDTEAMAVQLFQRLSQRNYSVFLDTVSIQPGVDFQQQLFEHLADKTMVVMLESATFFASTGPSRSSATPCATTSASWWCGCQRWGPAIHSFRCGPGMCSASRPPSCNPHPTSRAMPSAPLAWIGWCGSSTASMTSR
jgi:hypothetical protein